MLAKTFPATHPRAGEPTNFHFKIEALEKIHTIRANFPLWEKRIAEVNRGEAIISLREWTGRPYYTDQRELRQFGKGEVGIQVAEFDGFDVTIDGTEYYDWLDHIAPNDGLSEKDFKEWFRHTKKEPMAVIHFTDFRY